MVYLHPCVFGAHNMKSRNGIEGMNFQELKLMPELLRNVREAGYREPTPIQEATIPLVLEGRDVLGCAQTGAGKTAAFSLPLLQRLKQHPSRRPEAKVIRALILSPTRELAMQTWENIEVYSKGMGISSCVIFGGVGQGSQTEALHRGADIVVACPGRLMDLMGQGLVRLDWVEAFVLDEADRMLDMGFIHDVRRIIHALPEQRQNLLFSATMPPEVEKLALDLLNDPANVKVDPVTSTVEAIDQCLYYVDKVNKKHLLAHLLQSDEVENALVFSRTKHGVDRIVKELKRAGLEAVGIHGDKSQNARQTALNRFKSGEVKILVATDIAARGIDIAGLSHVINYDLPNEPEAYIHRIGRTGRAGREGKAISFCCIDEYKQLGQVEKLIGKRLREEQSDWPMENFTPSEPKAREPRPSRENARGEAVTRRAAEPATHAYGQARRAENRRAEAQNAGRRAEAPQRAETGRQPEPRREQGSTSGVRLVIPGMPGPSRGIWTRQGNSGRDSATRQEGRPAERSPERTARPQENGQQRRKTEAAPRRSEPRRGEGPRKHEMGKPVQRVARNSGKHR